jgi:hypothetical protein
MPENLSELSGEFLRQRSWIEEGVKLPDKRTKVGKHETRLGKSFWAAFPKKTQDVKNFKFQIKNRIRLLFQSKPYSQNPYHFDHLTAKKQFSNPPAGEAGLII